MDFHSLLQRCHLCLLLASLLCLRSFVFCQKALPHRVSIGFNYTITGTDYDDGTAYPILQSSNGAFQLQFGTLPGQASSHGLGVVHTESATLVWYTYRNNTLGEYDKLGGDTALVQLRSDGNLVVLVTGDEVDVLVWNSGTSNRGVEAMELVDEGSLNLINSSNGTVWQSFDHPTDTLLSTQRLRQGVQLLGAARNGYPFTGTNTLALQGNRAVAFVTYWHAEPYWQLRSSGNVSVQYAALGNGGFSLYDSNDRAVATIGNASVSEQILQRLTLGNDGNPRIYQYDNASKSWVVSVQFINEACVLPDDCGFYGLCIPGQGCQCPPSFSLLATLNGCVPPRGLACNSSYGNDFEKVPYASYFAIPFENLPNLTFENCKQLCTSNCSCLGFFHAAFGGSSRPCFVTYQLRTFSTSVYLNYTPEYNYDLYVRVQGKRRSPLRIILGVCVPVVVIAFCVALWWFVRFREKVAHQEEEEFLLEALPGLPPRFSYKELKTATQNFSHKIGEGAFGSVYDGLLVDGTRVAVKQLETALQGKKEFHAEVATIGTIRHVNLVRLCGFCLERNHRLLVYEHMAKGSLDVLLFQGAKKLSWEERREVALGLARGLAYLHEGCPECIIHCDIKPENVLVDEDGVTKLSDFGLSKLMNRHQTACMTTMRGTRGYLAPEWLTNIPITEKTDVYSYGVVLLEIISGRRNFELDEDSIKCFLPVWAFSSFENGNVQELLDSKVSDQVKGKEDEVNRALMVALWCIQEDAALRPSMKRVVTMLEGDVEVPPPPSSHLYAMRIQEDMESMVQSEVTRMLPRSRLLSNLFQKEKGNFNTM